MAYELGMAGIGAAATIANNQLGMGIANQMSDRAVAQSKELARYNKDLGLQMWKDTNYGAQVMEMKKAGLSVGNIYGKGGAGGTTANVAAPSVGTPNIPDVGLERGMGLAMQAAQIENLKADAEKKKAETAKTGEDTKLTVANTIAQEMENTYNQDTGYMNRRQLEAAQIYKTEMDGKLTEINVDQAPVYLQQDIQKTILEGQKVAIMAKEAETHREQVRVYERIEKLRMSLQSAMQTREINHQKSEGQANRSTGEYQAGKNREQQDKQLEQQNEHFYVNTTMRAVESALNAIVPWYEPSQTTTTENWDKHGEFKGGTTTTRTRK